MVKTYNTSKSNTKSTGEESDEDVSEEETDTSDRLKAIAPGATLLMNSSSKNQDAGSNLVSDSSNKAMASDASEKSGAVDHNSTRSNRGRSGGDEGGGGTGDAKSGAVDHNTTRSNRKTSAGEKGGTTGLKSTLGLMKSGFTLATVIVIVAAGADVYKMYDDHVTINLEDHMTDANFWLTPDKNSIVGEIGFDIPKMGYFEKSIETLIHLKVQESDPTTEDGFTFEYTLGSGEMIYDKFELNNLDPVTKDKIDKGEPLNVEYTINITIVYLGVELSPTTSDIGTKVTTIQTA